MRFLRSLQKKAKEQVPEIVKTNGHKEADINNLPFEPPSIREIDPIRRTPGVLAPEIALPNGATDTATIAQILPVSIKPITRFRIDPADVHPRLITIIDPHSHYCEDYRSLRTHVLHESERTNLQTLVIMSVEQSEGKSVTAMNLAWILAQTDGLSTLIIDADLRNPSLAAYIGMQAKIGLSDVLTEQIPLIDALIQLEPSGLNILPGGRPMHDAAEMISGPRFVKMLNEARGMFDLVIVDTPPLNLFTDGTVIANDTDGAILVVRANRVNFADIARNLEGLPKEKMIGAVLNDAAESKLGGSYYRYQNYNNSQNGQFNKE